MNLPNKLSVVRICLIPLLVLLLYLTPGWCRYAACAVFVAAALTDTLDGQIARRKDLVTNFGKFVDPVADKLLVLSTLVALCGLGEFPAWAVIVILFRELAVDGLRLVACEQGKVIAAGPLGKIKTTLQMVTLVWLLLRASQWLGQAGEILNWVLIAAVVAITLWSGVDYFIRNRSVFEGGMK